MRILTRQELEDIICGCTILGTGGGGRPEDGMAMIEEALAAGKQFKLADFDELGGDDYVGTPYGCGAISPLTDKEREKYARLTETNENMYYLAMKQIENFLGKNLSGVISTELGGMNTATAFYCAAMADKLIMDADPAGRSVPALQHSTYFLNNIPMYPISVMNKFGEGAIFTYVFDDMRGEDLIRALAVASQNSIAVVDHVNTAAVLKNAVIRGAISYAEKIGKVFRGAKANGGNCSEAVIAAGGGKLMFKGRVQSNEWETRDGYTLGTMLIQGTENNAGSELKIWYQNENIISWLDGKYYVTVPDLICVMNEDACQPQLNPYAEAGTNVTVFALPAPKEWTVPRGLEVFGPGSFGYDVEYSPFCRMDESL
jgi:DUF917 family protein